MKFKFTHFDKIATQNPYLNDEPINFMKKWFFHHLKSIEYAFGKFTFLLMNSKIKID